MVTRIAALAIALAAACYRPSPPSGELACSADGQCPDGYRCAVDQRCWRTGEGPGDDGGVDGAPPFTQAPRAISPRNGAATGTVRAALTRRPLFRWRGLPEATRYELQVDDTCNAIAFRDCDFPSPEASETTTATSLRLSAGLGVATTAPVGRRYYWRVRGCGDAQCTPWSEVRYLDVGRNLTDFTGDGDTDLVIGNANATVNGNNSAGAAYVEVGGGGGLPMSPLTEPGATTGDHFGVAAASAGDVNGDGYADLAVSADAGDQGGRIRLYLGNPSGPGGAPSQTLPNPEGQTVAYFGHAMVGGDIDGDGRSDLIVGAEIQDGTTFSEGKVFVFSGADGGVFATPVRTLDNPAHQEQGYFGSALAIGDFDGDGYADLAVAARQQDAVGRVFVYRSGPTGLKAQPPAALDDPVISSNAGFGYALAAGDFDGDGYADLAVGAATEAVDGKSQVGHVYVFHGGPDGVADRAAPWRTLDNPTGKADSIYGWALVAADFNADDADDLVVSAAYQDTAAGRVHVYHGAPGGLPAQPSRTLLDPAPVNSNDFFGYVIAAGDRSPGDGFADLFVGAARDNGTIYLFNGSSTGVPESTGATIGGGTVPGGDLGPSSLSGAPP